MIFAKAFNLEALPVPPFDTRNRQLQKTTPSEKMQSNRRNFVNFAQTWGELARPSLSITPEALKIPMWPFQFRGHGFSSRRFQGLKTPFLAAKWGNSLESHHFAAYWVTIEKNELA